MAVQVRNTSRLRWSRWLSVSNVEFWDLPEYPSIDAADDDAAYVVSRTDRIDLISNNQYGTPDLWWIIALRNGLRLVPNDLYEGQTIYLPSNRRVYDDILRRPNGGEEGA